MLILGLALLLVFVVFDVVAVEWGVDSRPGINDTHQG